MFYTQDDVEYIRSQMDLTPEDEHGWPPLQLRFWPETEECPF